MQALYQLSYSPLLVSVSVSVSLAATDRTLTGSPADLQIDSRSPPDLPGRVADCVRLRALQNPRPAVAPGHRRGGLPALVRGLLGGATPRPREHARRDGLPGRGRDG